MVEQIVTRITNDLRLLINEIEKLEKSGNSNIDFMMSSLKRQLEQEIGGISSIPRKIGNIKRMAESDRTFNKRKQQRKQRQDERRKKLDKKPTYKRFTSKSISTIR